MRPVIRSAISGAPPRYCTNCDRRLGAAPDLRRHQVRGRADAGGAEGQPAGLACGQASSSSATDFTGLSTGTTISAGIRNNSVTGVKPFTGS